MFKHPFEVKVNDASFALKHDITVNSEVIPQANELVKTMEKSAMRVIFAAALAATASQVVTHIAKTKI